METKTWLTRIVAVAAVLLTPGLTAPAEMSESRAREYVKRGALIVDVRTVEEFKKNHLPAAVNIPLAEVKQQFPRMVTNRTDVVLLHCLSGRRSAVAEKELRELGYTNVFNIGSLDRARKILAADERR